MKQKMFATFDVYSTLKGMSGDVSLEGNPIMRHMMLNLGSLGGLIAAAQGAAASF